MSKVDDEGYCAGAVWDIRLFVVGLRLPVTSEHSRHRCGSGTIGITGRRAVAPGAACRRRVAKQPEQKYFMTNDHESEYDGEFME